MRSGLGRGNRDGSGLADENGDMGKPITQFCSKCRKKKPIKGFNIRLGVCADCKAFAGRKGKSPVKEPTRPQPSLRSWKCPRCLQRVQVRAEKDGFALVQHVNRRRETCRGSGHVLPKQSQDALDHRLPGSFESNNR